MTDDTESRDPVGDALRYLARTEDDYAKAKATRIYLEETQRTVRATLFVGAEGKSVAEREAKALSATEYSEHCAKLRDAVYDEEILRAKRLRYELSIEVWRTKEASRRRGNV
jgi:hypothetical protein